MPQIVYQGRLEKWSPYGREVAGTLADSRRPNVFPDGSAVITSEVAYRMPNAIITNSGSLYVLGEAR